MNVSAALCFTNTQHWLYRPQTVLNKKRQACPISLFSKNKIIKTIFKQYRQHLAFWARYFLNIFCFLHLIHACNQMYLNTYNIIFISTCSVWMGSFLAYSFSLLGHKRQLNSGISVSFGVYIQTSGLFYTIARVI